MWKRLWHIIQIAIMAWKDFPEISNISDLDLNNMVVHETVLPAIFNGKLLDGVMPWFAYWDVIR